MHGLKAQYDLLIPELESVRLKLSDREKLLADKDAVIIDIRGEVVKTSIEINRLGLAEKESQRLLASCEGKNKDLMKTLSVAQEEFDKKFKDQLDATNDVESELKKLKETMIKESTERLGLEATVSRLELLHVEQRDTIETAKDERNQTISQMMEIESTMKQLREELTKASSENARLQALLEESHRTLKEREMTLSDVQKLNKSMKEELERVAKDRDMLSKDLEHSQQRLDEANKLNTSVDEELRTSRGRIWELEKELRRLQNELIAASSNNAQVATTLAAQEARNKELQDLLSTTAAEKALADESSRAMKSELDTLQDELAKAKKDGESSLDAVTKQLKNRIEVLENELQTQSRALEEANEVMDGLGKEKENLASTLVEVKEALLKSHNDYARVMSESESRNNEIGDLLGVVKGLERDVRSSMEENGKLLAKIEKLEEELNMLNAELVQSKEDLVSANQNYASQLTTLISDMKGRYIGDMSTENVPFEESKDNRKALEDEIKSYSKALEEANEVMDGLGEEKEVLESALVKAQVDMSSRDKRIKELEKLQQEYSVQLSSLGSHLELQAENIKVIKDFVIHRTSTSEKTDHDVTLEQECFDLRAALKNVCALLEEAQKLIISRDADLTKAEEKIKYCLEKNELLLVELQQLELSSTTTSDTGTTSREALSADILMLTELRTLMMDTRENADTHRAGMESQKLVSIKLLLEENHAKFTKLMDNQGPGV